LADENFAALSEEREHDLLLLLSRRWWMPGAHGDPELRKDKRLSTSKTTAVIWTYSLASALLSFVIAKWWAILAARCTD
jgi:hypothetical protein